MLGSVVLLWLFLFLLFILLSVRRPAGFPPGPPPLPVFGNLLQLSPTNPLRDIEKLSRRYGSVFSLYVGTRPVVVLNGVKAIREALVTRAAEFSGRPRHLLINHLDQNKGIIVGDGSRWREGRRFALTTLKNFGLGKSSMEERILEEVTHISAELEASDGDFLDPQVLFHLGASNIICSLVFGDRFDHKDPFFLTLIRKTQELTTLAMGTWAVIYELFPPLRILPLPFRRVFDNYRMLKEHAQKAVDEHKLSRVAGEPRDLLDSYLDQIDKTSSDLDTTFDEAEMVILLVDLFIGGTDTTSTTLRCAMLFMMQHPDIQERCHREIEAVLGGRPYPSYEDRHAMPFVQATIHETQRVADILPLSLFHATRRDTQLQGYRIPQGTTVIPNLSSALREHGQWKFPLEFNPENFLNDDGEFVKPDAFLPFSAGSRACLGENLARMELFLILVTLLRQFRFVWPEGSGPADVGSIFGAIQSPKPYNLGVCLRNRQH